ncbi:MAG: lytic transglycosylase domain-containing protein, partial [Oscillospiraceae bacterium]
MKQRTRNTALLTLLLLIITASCLIFGLQQVQKIVYPLKYEREVDKWAREFDVDPLLVYAVIDAESGFSPNAVSHANAHGLMQITEDTFEWAVWKMKTEDSFDDVFVPDVNIKYGTYILSLLTHEFGSVPVALAAYNAGRGNVLKWLKDKEISPDGKSLKNIPFEETKN